MPRWPLKSAIPNESMRPVSVTSPAPTMTPRIPNKGRVESSEGIAAAVARAISGGVGGRVVIAGAAMNAPLSSCANCGNYGKTRSQFGGQIRIIQPDLYRDALNHLGEVSCSIIGGQQRKLPSAGGRHLDARGANGLARVSVNANFCGIAHFHVG